MKPSRTSITTVSIGLLAIALPLAITPANANLCTNPGNKTAQFICSNPQLKQIEEVISKSYFEKRSELSPMEQAEIERDQKLWLSYLKNCKVDENCIRDAFDQRLTDIQEFDKDVEAANVPTDEATTDDTTETADLEADETTVDNNSEVADLGRETDTESDTTATTSSPSNTAEKTQEAPSESSEPSLLTRFTGWLFPKKAKDEKQLAVKNAVPAAPVPTPSDLEIAAKAPATIAAAPSNKTATNTVVSGSTTTTSQIAQNPTKHSTAKPLAVLETEQTRDIAVAQNNVSTTAKEQAANNTDKPAQDSQSAPTFINKIKNIFLPAKTDHPATPAKKITNDKAPVADIAKQDTPTTSSGNAIAQQNAKNLPNTAQTDEATATPPKDALQKAKLRRLAQEKANIRWRAVMKKRRAAAKKRNAKKRALRKARLRRKMRRLRAKKKAALRKKQRLKNTKTHTIRKRKTVKSVALRSKNRKRIAKKSNSKKKSATISYSFPANALPSKSKYVKNSCKNCSKTFHLSHHLRSAY